MAGFGKSFESSFDVGLQKGADMAQERLRARLRREEKEEDRKRELEQIAKDRVPGLKSAGLNEEQIKEYEGTSLSTEQILEQLNTQEQMKLDEKQRALDEQGILIGSVEAAKQAGLQLTVKDEKLRELKDKLGVEEPKTLREKLDGWIAKTILGSKTPDQQIQEAFKGTRTAGFTGDDYRDILKKSGYDAQEEELLRQAATMPKYATASQRQQLSRDALKFKNEYEEYQRNVKDSIANWNKLQAASAEGIKEAKEALKNKYGISMHPREVGWFSPTFYYDLLSGVLGEPTKEDFEWGGKVFDIIGPNGTGPEGLEKLFRGRDITEQHIKIIEAISKQTDRPLTREEIIRYADKSPSDIKKPKRKRFKLKAF
jgi:hypothetical protein